MTFVPLIARSPVRRGVLPARLSRCWNSLVIAPLAASRRRQALAALDDRMLADIGLLRAGGDYVRDADALGGTADSVRIRESVEADMPHVQRIYAHHVLHGAASFEETPPSATELAGRRAHVLRQGLPYLVAILDGAVAGYSYATPYRARSAYRYTVEDSVYVADGLHRHGIGRALLAALIARCERGPWRQMIAVIGDSANAPSIGLHERLGFKHAGTLRSVGWKFDTWTDSVLMQRPLNAGSRTNP